MTTTTPNTEISYTATMKAKTTMETLQRIMRPNALSPFKNMERIAFMAGQLQKDARAEGVTEEMRAAAEGWCCAAVNRILETASDYLGIPNV